MTGILNLLAGAVSSVVKDTYFNLVSLLLPGDGTNGAQNNTFLDSSTNNFTITRNGNTTQGTFSPFSQTGWSNFFNGSSDYLNAPAGSAFAFGTGSWTVEAWVYVTSLASEILLFDTRSSASTAGVGCRIATDGTLSYSGSANNALTTTAITTNTWNHVAFVYDGTTLSGYINGSRGGTATPSFNITQNNGVIGRVGFSASGYMAGYISNLRVVKGTAVYSGSSFTVPTAALTAITNTSLLTCQSNRFIDNSSNAFAITVNSNPSVQAFSPFAPTAAYSAATVGGSGYFDGTGDYLTTPSTAVFNVGTGNFTVETWIYPNSITANTLLFISFNTSNGIGVGFQATNAWGLVNSGVAWVLTTSTMPTVGQWNHLVVCRGGTGTNQTAIFLNGTRVATGTVTTSFSQTSAYGIGYDGANTAFNGYMSSLRVVTSDVYGFNNSTITVPTAPLTAITNTQLLLNYTNAGIIDATAKNVLETVGNAQISTTQSKFGGSSMYFDGTGDYLTFPASQNWVFGTGDFTIEFWIYANSLASTAIFIECRNNTVGPVIFYDSGALRVNFNSVGGTLITGGSLSTATWHHIALSRSGSSTRLFVNGTQSGSTATDTNNYSNNTLIVGASYLLTQTLNGYIDDLRISKYARYTANFTAPTSAFPLQ